MQITKIYSDSNTADDISFLDLTHVQKIKAFHQSFPLYKETPLVDLKNLSKRIGLKNFFVKDESYRFGLNAFKVLGGSFAIGKYIAQKLNMDISDLSYEKLISSEIHKQIGNITFVTATDGNHGRGVAWTANQLKQKSVVYMPKGSSLERLKNIQAENADASITDLNYDDAVRLANENAKKYGWVVIQDTSWENYQDIPRWIIQGYSTMAYEAYTQISQKPTHIFIQAGVGSLAGAITGFFANAYKEDKPIITVVEPEIADCIFRTAKANDQRLHFVKGNMPTIMAGLACGEPCDIGWNILKKHADFAITCADNISAKGMRLLGAPLSGDTRIISGESGAVTSGLVAELMTNDKYKDIRNKLQLNADSVVLCFSTEGATDKQNYEDIVWNGKFSNY